MGILGTAQESLSILAQRELSKHGLGRIGSSNGSAVRQLTLNGVAVDGQGGVAHLEGLHQGLGLSGLSRNLHFIDGAILGISGRQSVAAQFHFTSDLFRQNNNHLVVAIAIATISVRGQLLTGQSRLVVVVSGRSQSSEAVIGATLGSNVSYAAISGLKTGNNVVVVSLHQAGGNHHGNHTMLQVSSLLHVGIKGVLVGNGTENALVVLTIVKILSGEVQIGQSLAGLGSSKLHNHIVLFVNAFIVLVNSLQIASVTIGNIDIAKAHILTGSNAVDNIILVRIEHLGTGRRSDINFPVSHIQGHVRNSQGDGVARNNAFHLGVAIAQPHSGDGSISHVGSDSSRDLILLGGVILSGNSDDLGSGQVNIAHFPLAIGLLGSLTAVHNHFSNGLVGGQVHFNLGQVGFGGRTRILINRQFGSDLVAINGGPSVVDPNSRNSSVVALLQLNLQIIGLSGSVQALHNQVVVAAPSAVGAQAVELNSSAGINSSTIDLNIVAVLHSHVAVHSVLHLEGGVSNQIAIGVVHNVLGQGDGDGVGDVVLVLVGDHTFHAVNGEGSESISILANHDGVLAGVGAGLRGHSEGGAVVGVGGLHNSSAVSTGNGDFGSQASLVVVPSQNHVNFLLVIVEGSGVNAVARSDRSQVGGGALSNLVQVHGVGANHFVLAGGVIQLQSDGIIGRVVLERQFGASLLDLGLFHGGSCLHSAKLQIIVGQFLVGAHFDAGSLVPNVHCERGTNLNLISINVDGSKVEGCSRSAERNHCDDQHQGQKHRK
ncbi:unknown [Clostridium sp. CAG:1013]|nr:unknown [Clostridium sp. CAG:1013]